MRQGLVGLVIAAAALVPTGVAAQDDADALLARCESGASDDVQLATCQWVVTTVLAPVPGASSAPYGADLPGPGVTLARDDETVTLVDVDWNAGKSIDRKPGDPGLRFVAIRVLYEGTADGASYNPLDWTLVDMEGYEWGRAFIGKSPELRSSNDLPAGRKAQGWVTFEVPRNVATLEVVQSQGDYLRWIITEAE